MVTIIKPVNLSKFKFKWKLKCDFCECEVLCDKQDITDGYDENDRAWYSFVKCPGCNIFNLHTKDGTKVYEDDNNQA